MHHHNLELSGSGEHTLMFVHGYGCDQDMWRGVAPAFTDSWRVATLDLPGCGRRSLVPFDPSRFHDLEDYADALIALIREQQLAPVVFVGHSVSAMIGALVHLRAPECVRALAMIGPSPCYINEGSYPGGFSAADVSGLLDALHANRHAWAASMAPLIMGNADRPELGEELQESFCRMDPKAAEEFARITFTSDHRKMLPQVSVPTLILQCRNDPIASEAVGAYVHAQIPNSELVQLEATGHCPNVSAPAEVIAVLRPWLDSLDT